ncbi:unnamed protein product [Ilex paraguariensis]|uniref:Uncharacterized protein n=1 Tax=Ilex paraguariensis TaxID=185542 RepID=A0ABC8T6H6_9AQUA
MASEDRYGLVELVWIEVAASVGYEMASDRAVTMETPIANLSIRSSSVRSSTSGLKTEPLS